MTAEAGPRVLDCGAGRGEYSDGPSRHQRRRNPSERIWCVLPTAAVGRRPEAVIPQEYARPDVHRFDRPPADRPDPRMAGAARPSRVRQGRPPARAVRGRRGACHAVHRRGRGPVPRLLEAPDHGRDRSSSCSRSRRWPAWRNGGPRCSPGGTSTSPRTGRSSTRPCACPRPTPCASMTRTWGATSTRCSTGWPPSRSTSATARGRARRESASGTWSTSASAAATSGRRWRPRRSSTSPSVRCASGSCPTSTAPTSGTRPLTSTPRRRCSSSRARHSRRSRR